MAERHLAFEDLVIQNEDKSSEDINYCPPVHAEPLLRRCRVSDMWGSIRLDWNSDTLLPRAVGQLVSEESKMVLKPCSVRVEKCKVSSSSLVWGVEKVKLDDQTVQLLYHGVRVREGHSDGEMEILDDDGNSEKQDEGKVHGMHEETEYLGLKCPKCGHLFNDKGTLVCHVVSHYYELFHKVLPDIKPFPCPICEKTHKSRTTLVRHYAITHGQIFVMTDLTPEVLPGIGTGKGVVKCSKSRFTKKFLTNNNCPDMKNKHSSKKFVEDELAVKSEKDDDGEKIEFSGTDDQICSKCPKCDKYVKMMPRSIWRCHMLTHYYKVFYDVLPDQKPFNCPLCEQSSRDRISLARHYAFSHEKMFELTDLTPEDLLYSKRHMKELELKNKLDERIQVLLAPALTEVSDNAPNYESIENIKKEDENNGEDNCQTTTLVEIPFPSVQQKHDLNLDITFAA